MRRAAIWIGRGTLALLAVLALGIGVLMVFPLGCPISRHLPDSVAEATCDKSGNFPETRYELTAEMSRDAFADFVDTLQAEMPAGDWEETVREEWWMSAHYHSSTVILSLSWLRGDMSAKWFAQ